MILVLFLYALFASVFTIAKEGLDYTAPFFLVGSRMFVAGALMIGFQCWKNPSALRLKKEDWKGLVLLGMLNIYLTNVFEFWGLQYLTSFKTCFFYSLSPFISALFSYFILSEKLSWKKWLGLAVGFTGFIPILLIQGEGEAFAGEFWIFSWAELAVLSAATCSVFGWILLRKLVNRSKIPFFVANGYSMVIGGAFALFHSFCVESWNPIPTTDIYMFLKAFLLLILISNLVCYNLYGHLLKKFSATFMTFAGLVTPIFTALFGYFFLQETVSIEFFYAIGVVLLGLTIFYYEELRAERKISAPSLQQSN